MNYNAKDIMKMTVIAIVYVILGVMGIYSNSLIFLLPLLVAPMTLYLMSDSINIRRDLILNVLIGILIYIFSGSLPEVILYTLNVIIPAYIVTTLYRKNLQVPQIVMYTSTAIAGILCIYIVGLRYLGIDYVQQYFDLLNMYQSVQSEVFRTLGIASEQKEMLKQLIEAQVSILRIVYPALVFIIIIWLIVIQVSVVTLIGKVKKWHLPSLRQLAQFKFSKITVILFVIAFILVQGTGMGDSDFSILGWNLYFLINSLYQFVGLISLVVLIKRSKGNKIVKVAGVIITFILVYLSPSMLMMFGLLDTMFNYRKVKNVV
ncbi:MAG: DUF2232 domain-containing protein [Cellulosilyticaceae bacterium]